MTTFYGTIVTENTPVKKSRLFTYSFIWPVVACRILVASLEKIDAESLKAAAEHLLSQLGDPAAVVVGSSPGHGKVSLVATVSPSLVKQGIHAGTFVGAIAKLCGGGGGGRPNFAQAGGRQPEKLEAALEKARGDLKTLVTRYS